MPGELTLSTGTLFAFLLVLARVAGALSMVPLPGLKSSPEIARAALAVGFTFALAGQWPAVDASHITAAKLIGWAIAEGAVGLVIGISTAIVLESLTMAAQLFGMQAGYGYASTIDPNTQADSGILLVFSQLMGGLFFFTMGLDHDVFRLLAESLAKVPPGTFVFGPASAEPLIRLGSSLFSVGIRLALPVVSLLILVDVALALLGRLNAQLQLLTLAFPAKMLTALLVLSWIAALFPRLLREASGYAWVSTHHVLGL
jgi:flagellar biosynthetic protein FliR